MKHPKTTAYTLAGLQEEQRLLKLQIKQQEQQLRQHVQKLPGELVYAGVDALLPASLSGKISDGVLSMARNFINKTITQKTSGNTGRLFTMAKQAGLFALVKMAWRSLVKRK